MGRRFAAILAADSVGHSLLVAIYVSVPGRFRVTHAELENS
jgi:hypothetical protein